MSKDDVFESTIVTSIEKLELESEKRAYILFLAGPLQGKMHCLEAGSTTLGRAEDVDISINDNRISRKHFRIIVEAGQATLQDLKSTNGTYVNGKRSSEHPLESGDKIQISSSTIIKFAYGDEGERMFHEEFYQMANYDAITGVINKQAFIKRFAEEFSYAKRNEIPLSLIMFDIDFFKKVNDTYGHMAGDYVLGEVARTAHAVIRDEDIIARYGGEEFAVILRGSDKEGSLQLAERIRVAIENTSFIFEEQEIPTTISLGVATFKANNYQSSDELMAASDAMLYASKENGRNQVNG